MKKKAVPAILIHLDWIETIKCLSHEQDRKSYEEKCKKNSESAKMRWAKEKDSDAYECMHK